MNENNKISMSVTGFSNIGNLHVRTPRGKTNQIETGYYFKIDYTPLGNLTKRYTGCKGNKFHPFNSRRGRLKGSIYIYMHQYIYIYPIWDLTLIVLSKMYFLFSFLHVVLLTSLEIMRKHLHQ